MGEFVVGQRVVVVKAMDTNVLGAVTIITSELGWFESVYTGLGAWRHEVDLPDPDGIGYAFEPHELRALPDDSAEKADWESLPAWARKACERKERT